MNLFESLQQKEKVTLLVNRAEENNAIKVEDIEKVLHADVHMTFPVEQNVATNALNKGVPFVTGAVGSKLTTAVQNLIKPLLTGETIVPVRQKKANTGLFGLNK